MRKSVFRVLLILFAILVSFTFVACNQEDTPDPEPVVEYTTTYYMPKGWSVETPVWTTKEEGTVEVPASVLEGDFETEATNVTPELKAALAQALADSDYFKEVKNIIIIIGDGMGITHVRASEQWSGELIMTQLPNIGASKTLTREGIYTDSGAGGTAISSGYKTTKLFLSMDAEGNNFKSVSELARENGKLVGVVTNAELPDATPAAFSIHNKNRSESWTKICEQEVVFGADLFMGNGYGDFSEYFKSSSPLYKFVQANDMKLYSKAKDIVDHFSEDNKMWAIFSAKANKFARFDTKTSSTKDYPTLQQMTAYAISWLDSHADEDDGFIVMIENTYPDHFGHGNTPSDGSPNTYGIVKEVQSTDEAVAIALKYVLEHPDTALIVTADHETGDTRLKNGWETDFSKVKAQSGDHSTQNVPVFAIGKGTEELNSLSAEDRAAGKKWYEATPYENSLIGQVIGHLLGDPEYGGDDTSTDHSSKVSPKFDVTVTKAANTLTYSVDLTGAPIRSGNLIRFKIRPLSSSDTVKLELLDSSEETETWKTLFAEAQFSTSKAGGQLSPAYKQAMDKDSGLMEGWYQFSLNADSLSTKLRITLTGDFAAGSVIGMDDLTVQYASTVGELVFSSDNATSSLPIPAAD